MTAAQRSQIMSILGECGLTEGSSARRLENSTTAAERRILLEIPEAAWVDVTCVGFRLEAAVEMGTPAPEMLDSDAPCNLVASRAAAVVSHVVRDGVLVADTGSGVPEGGLLVSGTVADAAGNVILKHASAEIIGEYTETREFFVPYRKRCGFLRERRRSTGGWSMATTSTRCFSAGRRWRIRCTPRRPRP